MRSIVWVSIAFAAVAALAAERPQPVTTTCTDGSCPPEVMRIAVMHPPETTIRRGTLHLDTELGGPGFDLTRCTLVTGWAGTSSGSLRALPDRVSSAPLADALLPDFPATLRVPPPPAGRFPVAVWSAAIPAPGADAILLVTRTAVCPDGRTMKLPDLYATGPRVDERLCSARRDSGRGPVTVEANAPAIVFYQAAGVLLRVRGTALVDGCSGTALFDSRMLGVPVGKVESFRGNGLSRGDLQIAYRTTHNDPPPYEPNLMPDPVTITFAHPLTQAEAAAVKKVVAAVDGMSSIQALDPALHVPHAD